MGRRKKIELGQKPTYPSDDNARGYAEVRRQQVENGADPKTTFYGAAHSQSIDVKATWGYKGFYFVFAYPPAGFTIKDPDDVAKLQTFEGWIFKYIPQSSKFGLLVKASRDGKDLFWQKHNQIKHS